MNAAAIPQPPPRPGPAPTAQPRSELDQPASGTGHPVVDAAIAGIINATALPLAERIAQYEAAHRALRETLATIDQS